MIVETIVASIAFLISLVGVCLLRGSVDVEYHRKVVDELETSLTISFIIGIVGGFIMSVLMRAATIVVAVLVGLCLGAGLHPLCLLWRSNYKRKKEEYVHLEQKIVELAEKKGRILSPVDLVNELSIGSELANRMLKNFVKHKLARYLDHDLVYFPITRIPAEVEIIGKLKDRPEGITFHEIFLALKEKELSIESLRIILDRLESNGIIVHNHIQDKYALTSFYT